MHWPRLSRALAAAALAALAAAPPASARAGEVLQGALPQGAAQPEPPGLTAPEEPDPLFDDEVFGVSFDDADPLETTNRAVFRLNRGLDWIFFEPLTRAYRFAVPSPARRAVRRAVLNLNSPSIFVNDLLQLRFRDAAVTLGRFALNSTVGWGGLFEAGDAAGWPRHEADFGQTLAKAGVGSGPYLVIPLLGPSTVRDGFGQLVDRLFQPVTYLLGPGQQLVLGGGSGLVTRDAHYEVLDALEESSVDFYAALRSAYLQSRQAAIWGTADGPPAQPMDAVAY